MEYFYEPSSSIKVHDLPTVPIAEEVLQAFPLPDWLLDVWHSLNPSTLQPPHERLQTFVDERLLDYAEKRDLYRWSGTSGLSSDINNGALSIRQIYETAKDTDLNPSESWLRQLAWRDFYLYQAMRNPNYFTYEQQLDLSLLDDSGFERWASAHTGIPVIDAAMTQLNETGEMPNRLRMITAMFLTKQLLCPFTLGEAYFRDKLNDYDRVQNRGGWLWSSSLGYDAAPYFRVMNPVLQSEKFDPTGAYIRRWLPHLSHLSDKAIHQPQADAIVDLRAARERAIDVYGTMLTRLKQAKPASGGR